MLLPGTDLLCGLREYGRMRWIIMQLEQLQNKLRFFTGNPAAHVLCSQVVHSERMRKDIFRLLVISAFAALAITIMVMTRTGTASIRAVPQASATAFTWKTFQAEVPAARAGAPTYEYTIRKKSSDAVMSVGQVMDGWSANEEFRRFYVSQLKAAPFEAAFWETPPALTSTLDKPFRYVLVESHRLAGVREERQAFQEHFVSAGNDGVVAFYNLGGSSRLIAPVPKQGHRNYAHILGFMRTAPEEQATKMLQVISKEFSAALDDRKPLWLSTSGLGVFYTHVRLDPRPKYYQYGPYKSLAT